MYGSGMGNLLVEVRSQQPSVSPFAVWNVSGDQGKPWRTAAAVDLSQLNDWAPFRIAFVGQRGETIYSDMAIDDVQFANCDPSKGIDLLLLNLCIVFLT